MIRALLSLALLAAMPAVAAPRLDGNALLRRCSATDTKDCDIYLDGFAAALTILAPGARPACIPNGVNSAQMRRVLVKYLGATPQDLEKPGAALIGRAFAKAWPCGT